MIGGYLSFQGIDGKARYKDTPIEEVLPVKMKSIDDRIEVPEGMYPEITEDHVITAAFASDCAPHWGSKDFIEWNQYDKLWGQLIDWLSGEIG